MIFPKIKFQKTLKKIWAEHFSEKLLQVCTNFCFYQTFKNVFTDFNLTSRWTFDHTKKRWSTLSLDTFQFSSLFSIVLVSTKHSALEIWKKVQFGDVLKAAKVQFQEYLLKILLTWGIRAEIFYCTISKHF